MNDSMSVFAAMVVLFGHGLDYLATDTAIVLLLSGILMYTGSIAGEQ